MVKVSQLHIKFYLAQGVRLLLLHTKNNAFFSSFKKYAPTKGMWTSGLRNHLEKSKSCSLPLVENKNANAVRIARKQIEAIIQHTHHNALEKSLDLKPPAFNLGYYHSFSRFLSEYEFEKINFDDNTCTILPTGTTNIFIKTTGNNPKIERNITRFFNESRNELFIGTTKSAVNSSGDTYIAFKLKKND